MITGRLSTCTVTRKPSKQHARWFQLGASSDTRQTVGDIRFRCRMFVTVSLAARVRGRDLRTPSLIRIIWYVYSPGRTARSSFSRPPASSVPIVHRRISSLSLSPSVTRKKVSRITHRFVKLRRAYAVVIIPRKYKQSCGVWTYVNDTSEIYIRKNSTIFAETCVFG